MRGYCGTDTRACDLNAVCGIAALLLFLVCSDALAASPLQASLLGASTDAPQTIAAGQKPTVNGSIFSHSFHEASALPRSMIRFSRSAPVGTSGTQQHTVKNQAQELKINGKLPKDIPPDTSSSAPRLTGYKPLRNTYALPTPQHLLEMWEEVVAGHQPERVFGKQQKYMNALRTEQWNNIVSLAPSMPREKLLRVVNGFFNNWPSKSDQANYGVKEYWASPEEFLKKGSGDCEDYAIAKYMALRYLKWPVEDLWLVLVVEKKTKNQHAVLAARTGSQTFILDNLSKPRYLLIQESDYMKRYTPFFAVNESSNWLFAIPNKHLQNRNLAKALEEKEAIAQADPVHKR